MIPSLEMKTQFAVIPGALIDNTSPTTVSVDTAGWRWLDFLMLVGATDIAVATAKVQESDDDGSSDAYADVPNANFATGTLQDGTAAVVPAASGAFGDNTIHAVRVNLQGRKRYLKFVLTGGDGSTGAYLSVLAQLSRPSVSPTTAAGRGVAQELFA